MLNLLLLTYPAESGRLFFIEQVAWINAFGIRIDYALGVDGISIPLIILNNFITVLVVMAAWDSVRQRVAQYLAAFLIMAGIVNGVFAATDAMLFYVFF
ncbi:MAG: hypothetical protein R3E95_17430 [Thiolinea sp.]